MEEQPPPVAGTPVEGEDATRKRTLEQANSTSSPLLLDDRDFEALTTQLQIPKVRLLQSMSNETSLNGFKVTELKIIINHLRNKLKKSIKVSGNKSELVRRIADEIFRVQRTTSNNSTTTTPSPTPAAKRSRVTPPPSAAPSYQFAPPSVSYTTKNLAMPPNGTMNVNLNLGHRVDAFATPETLEDPMFLQQQNPYFQLVKQLLIIPFGPKTSGINDSSHVYSKMFSLDLPVLAEIDQGRRTGNQTLGVHVRLWHIGKKSDVAWGYESNLSCNSRHVDLSKTYKKIRAKNLQDPFITPYPGILTPYVSQKNVVEFTNSKGISGYAVVQLIREAKTAELVSMIPKRDSSQFRKSVGAGEVEETKVQVALRCPLGYCRIQNPAKGIHCEHLQCFDVSSYLEFSHQQRLWHCPVCNRALPFNELVIDEYFLKILDTMDAEVTKATIHPDGTFGLPEKSAPRPRLAPRSSGNITEISLDDDVGQASAPTNSTPIVPGQATGVGGGSVDNERAQAEALAGGWLANFTVLQENGEDLDTTNEGGEEQSGESDEEEEEEEEEEDEGGGRQWMTRLRESGNGQQQNRAVSDEIVID